MRIRGNAEELWFAEKFVSLLIEQHRLRTRPQWQLVVICWKIRIFAYWTTPDLAKKEYDRSCDLLKNSYLCLLNNTRPHGLMMLKCVVICWKIRIFAYWTTPRGHEDPALLWLWFAEKFVSLLIEQHLTWQLSLITRSCDLLKNSYLCLLNNTSSVRVFFAQLVVICWKIRIFAYWTTPHGRVEGLAGVLWFAEKFVSLLIEQHLCSDSFFASFCCDLLKNSYLCLLNNTQM